MNNTSKIWAEILLKGDPDPQDRLYILHLSGGHSPRSIANDINVSRQNVSQVIHGTHSSLPVAEHISFVTGLSIKSLFGTRYDHLIERRERKRTNEAA